jgi:hypothetical protein
MTRAGDLSGEHSRDWAAKFGVDRKALWSAATTWDNSNALLISLASDATYGRCYLWHHEEGYNLVPIAETFEAAIEALRQGFVNGDTRVRGFLL